MRIKTLKERLKKNRKVSEVRLSMPADVVRDLKRLAPQLGFSSYQALLRAYVGQGLRADLERVDNAPMNALVASLKRRGISEKVIQESLSEAAHH